MPLAGLPLVGLCGSLSLLGSPVHVLFVALKHLISLDILVMDHLLLSFANSVSILIGRGAVLCQLASVLRQAS